MTLNKDGVVVLRWSNHPRCVALARLELRKALEHWGLALVQDSAVLILSELLTNAGRHAHVTPGREIETWFQPLPGGVRIEVQDTSSGMPELRTAPPDAECGRGLELVAALSSAWGVSVRGGIGKLIWAEVSLRSDTGGGHCHE
jgi:serine/threonine-protein kinase RsbW